MFGQTALDGNNDAAQGSRTTPNYAVTVVQGGQTSCHPVLVVRDDVVKLTCSTDSRDVKSNHSHCAARTLSLVGVGTVCAQLCSICNSKRSTSGDMSGSSSIAGGMRRSARWPCLRAHHTPMQQAHTPS